MAQLDLRPLTVGEILDRTFTLYRRHFLLFIGISAVPQVMVLAFQLARTLLSSGSGPRRIDLAAGYSLGAGLLFVATLLISLIATLFSQGATIFAVSDLYLRRPVTLSDCLRRAWAEIGTVFGVGLLNGLAVLVGTIALVIPGFYILCRLSIATPAALIERRGPQDALSRSWSLTKENTGRAFVLLLVYFVISIAGAMLIGVPFGIGVVTSRNNPAALQLWTSLAAMGNALVNILVIPILLIATCLFYFDLRVRKEAFDLQFMMDPNSERSTPPGDDAMPSIV
ncbi:MAG TPA: glycerophosphoryl diester phosphodiesterase membrane domain-containing protein [Bryobacteraceae bacterium]|nr:glycerophosphoryl diester phosphodiesterase membrane domain-containing protein [Bryobacteraceae bacterium]